jgi:DtxR family Mn-dependent transcriptional regulator
LAGELSIQPVSANQMVHKLAEEGLVEYLPYKGAQLTLKGQEIARKVLRDRRLWEVFLVEHLELPHREADALACRLEHITAEGIASRLANYLGQPTVSPQGLPIPEVEGRAFAQALRPLSDLAVGESGEVMRLEGDPATQAFLIAEGLCPGLRVKPLAIGGNGAMLLEVGDSRLNLAKAITDKILINT